MKRISATVLNSTTASVHEATVSCAPTDDITQAVLDHVAEHHAAESPTQQCELTATMDGKTWGVIVHADGSTSDVPAALKTSKKDTAPSTSHPAAKFPVKKVALAGTVAATLAVTVALAINSWNNHASHIPPQPPKATSIALPGISESVGAGKILTTAKTPITPALRKNNLVTFSDQHVRRISSDGKTLWSGDAPKNATGKLQAGRLAGREIIFLIQQDSVSTWDWTTGARLNIPLAEGEFIGGTDELVVLSDTTAKFASSQKDMTTVSIPKNAKTLLVSDSGSLLVAHDGEIKAVTTKGTSTIPLPVPSEGFKPVEVHATGETLLVHWENDETSILAAHDSQRALSIRWVAQDIPVIRSTAAYRLGASPDGSWVRLGDSVFDVATGASADIEGDTVRMTDVDLWTDEGHAGRVGEIFETTTGTVPVLADASTAVWKVGDQWVWAERKKNAFGESIPENLTN